MRKMLMSGLDAVTDRAVIGLAGDPRIARLDLPAVAPGFAAPRVTTSDLPFHTPRYYEWNLEVQQEIGFQSVLSLNYVGNHGFRLNAGSFANMNQLSAKYLALGDALQDDISMHPNIPLPYAGFTGTVAQALLPYPQYAGGGVVNHYPYVGKSDYNALQVVATRRLSKGLGFLISYAFQKTLTNTDSANRTSSKLIESLAKVLAPFGVTSEPAGLPCTIVSSPAILKTAFKSHRRWLTTLLDNPSRTLSSRNRWRRSRVRSPIWMRTAACS